jgi:hypothetical protein
LFREIFEFRLIQTDPNFANYRYDSASQQLILLDFGATRSYQAPMIEHYRRLMHGATTGNRPAMNDAAQAIGYFQVSINDMQRNRVLDLFALACEPLRHDGEYDFGRSDLPARIRDAAWCSVLIELSGTPHPPTRCFYTASWVDFICWRQG